MSLALGLCLQCKKSFAVAFKVTLKCVFEGGMQRKTERLVNRTLGRQERMVMAALARATQDMETAIHQEELKQKFSSKIQNTNGRSTYEECELTSKRNLCFWRTFKERLTHRSLVMLKQELIWRPLRRIKQFSFLISRLMRREREKEKTAFLKCIIDPFFNEHGEGNFLFTLPDDWPKRDKIYCPVCVIQYMEERKYKRKKRWYYNKKPQLFAAGRRSCSVTAHMQSWHSDGGSNRACIGCDSGKGVCRPNEKGCLVHQLITHFSYRQSVALELARTICTEDRLSTRDLVLDRKSL